MKCSDYRRMNEQDQYESVGLDDSLEDERDLDQILQDRRAAELELEARDGRVNTNRKLPQLLHDQGYFSVFHDLDSTMLFC
jgi:DNA replication licensing factor MCM2